MLPVVTHADDRWNCCYVLLENRSAEDVAALLGDHFADPQRSGPETARPSAAAWPLVAPVSDRWTALADPLFQFGDAWDELREWSQDTRVVCLLLVQRELFSHALVWVDREMVWQVSFEGESDDRPVAAGQVPFDPDILGRQLGPADDPRTWFRVPVAAVELLTDWQPESP